MKTTVKTLDGKTVTVEPRGAEVALVPGGAFSAFVQFLDPHSAQVFAWGLLRAAVAAQATGEGASLSPAQVDRRLQQYLRDGAL